MSKKVFAGRQPRDRCGKDRSFLSPFSLKTLFLTNEYPPHVYGGAGVHVEYLARELAKLMTVEVRCFGISSR